MSDTSTVAERYAPALQGDGRFLGFTFERESWWLVALYVLGPLVAILLWIVIPGLWRRWFT